MNASSLPVAVVGGERPEAIPDYIAYRHFLMVTSVTANASAQQLGRRDAFLSRVNLSDNDRAAYIGALAGVDEELRRISEERRQLSRTSTTFNSRLAELKILEGRVFADAQSRIRGILTSEGAKRLDAHIQQVVKKGIVIYGEIPRQ